MSHSFIIKPGAFLGYRKNGQPIYNIGGGSHTAVGDPAGSLAPPTTATAPQNLNINLPPNSGTAKYFTAEDLERIRQQEKDKLYKAQEALKAQTDAMQAELAELKTEREARQAEEKRRADEVKAAKKAAEEAELSAKEIISRREEEWGHQLSQLKGQMEQQSILFAKEREFQELKGYVNLKIEENREKIIPELYDMVSGNTKPEIDASIASVIAKSAAILEGVNRMHTEQKAGMPGVSTTGFTPNGPLDGIPGQQRPYTAEDIAAMSMQEYAEKIHGPLGLDNNNDYSMAKLWG